MKRLSSLLYILLLALTQTLIGQIPFPEPDNLVLESWEISDTEFQPEQFIAITYRVCNSNFFPVDAGLGASVRPTDVGVGEIVDCRNDTIVSVSPGCGMYEPVYFKYRMMQKLDHTRWHWQFGTGIPVVACSLRAPDGWMTYLRLFLLLRNPLRYQVRIENTWSEATHPGNFPIDAHFSWFGGATHNWPGIFLE